MKIISVKDVKIDRGTRVTRESGIIRETRLNTWVINNMNNKKIKYIKYIN